MVKLSITSFLVGLAMVGGAKPPSFFTLAVARARTHDIAPQKTAPDWMDWERVKNGLAFYAKHEQGFTHVLATTSLVGTYAGVDIAPVTVHTGKLVKGYTRRIMETGIAISQMLQPRADKAAFIANSYSKAYELGLLHQDIAKSIKPEELGWKSTERHVMNQQAFALVLYAFAWQPIESLEATKEIDPVKDAAGIEDWMYLWKVFGTGLGVEAILLPGDIPHTKAMVSALRAAQYPAEGQPAAPGSDLLVTGELKMLMQFKGLSGPTGAQKAAVALEKDLSYSPGLEGALRLGPDPVATLTKLAEK